MEVRPPVVRKVKTRAVAKVTVMEVAESIALTAEHKGTGAQGPATPAPMAATTVAVLRALQVHPPAAVKVPAPMGGMHKPAGVRAGLSETPAVDGATVVPETGLAAVLAVRAEMAMPAAGTETAELVAAVVVLAADMEGTADTPVAMAAMVAVTAAVVGAATEAAAADTVDDPIAAAIHRATRAWRCPSSTVCNTDPRTPRPPPTPEEQLEGSSKRRATLAG